MERLKDNWKFEILRPGFLLIWAFLLVDLSLLIYQAVTPVKKLTCLVFAFYFSCLLLRKYRHVKWFTGFIVFIVAVIVVLNLPPSKFALRDDSKIKLYPDQIKIDGNWMSGEGHVQKGKVLVSAVITKNQAEQISLGHTVWLTKLTGKVALIAPATNYGQFDAQNYYSGKNVYQQIKLKNCQINVQKGGLMDYFHHLRFCLQQYFKKMPNLLGFFSSELVLGESLNKDNQGILNKYRDLGVVHILSISGLHVGIYSLVLTTLCFYFKMTEKEAFACCLAILSTGIFLSGGQAGFIRASLTYILGQVFKFKKIQITKFDLLGLTCLLHLAINPRLMVNVGALLSYVLALGLELTSKMTSLKQTTALNLLLTPLLLLYFFQFNFLTVLFNMLVVPYFNWLVMPLTFGNLIIFALTPKISWAFEKILEQGERFIGLVSSTKAGLLTFGKINWWQCLLLLILTAISLAYVNDRMAKEKVEVKLISGLLFIYVTLFLTIHFPLVGQVTFIDVGQGDSILITTPSPRRVYMIDVGGRLNFGGKKLTPQVNKITIPLLKAQGISQIDGVFVTHQDADHVGDLRPLLKQVRVKKLYTPAGLIKNPSFVRRINRVIKKRQVVELLAGKRINEPQIKFYVVYPFKPGLGKNEDSLSLTFSINNKSWLFTGDLGQDGEKELMHKYGLQVNYFKLGHHGSRTASNPEFLKILNPELVFISAGRGNRFGHPHQETLDTLKSQHIPWVSTQDRGMITWTYSKWTKPKFSTFLQRNQK